MLNGSLDATAMVYLAQHTDGLEKVEFCNALLEPFTEWLQTQHEFDAYFVFHGKRMARATDLPLVARYYVMLARVESRLWGLKWRPLPEPIPLSFFYEEKNDEYERLKAILGYSLGKKTRAWPLEKVFKEGNTALELMVNYSLARLKVKFTQLLLKSEVGFPSFRNYESEIKEQLKEATTTLETEEKELAQRTEALLLRLRYDSILRKIDYLQKD